MVYFWKNRTYEFRVYNRNHRLNKANARFVGYGDQHQRLFKQGHNKED